MTTTTIQFSWRELVVRANPEHERESRDPVEYEFSSPGTPHTPNAEKTHVAGQRVFRANNYQERGAYATETASESGLTWGSLSLEWDDDELTWGDS